MFDGTQRLFEGPASGRRHLLIKLPANGAVRDQRFSQRSTSLLLGLPVGQDGTRFRNVALLLTVDKK